MKKLTAIILTAALILAFTACDNGGEGISQAEADRLQREIDRLQNALDNATGGNTGNGNSPFASVSVGDIIEFGQLDWLVLAVEDGKALILSDKIIENRVYHSPWGEITWEHSSLREFLNGSFYNSTFTEQEKGWIEETNIINNDNAQYGTSGGNDTVDKIFLLSIDEVNTYMGNDSHINLRNAKIAEHLATGNIGWWWLRSPGSRSDRAAGVREGGYVGVNGNYVGDFGGVRPALWLNL
jgi:hypothetical protein